MASAISWAGAGPHQGHTITPTDVWPTQLEEINSNLQLNVVSCGRVRCTCGAEWNVGGWPPEVFDQLEIPCERVTTYRCMCRSGIAGRGDCGCRLTGPPTHFHDDGRRYLGSECAR